MNEKLTLFIEQNASDKLWAFTMLCKQEISGLGKFELRDGQFYVTDVAIFKQTVSGVHSTITAQALAQFQSERVKAGESLKQWCLWWHSHADMAVFFSGTDTNTIDESTDFPYLVSLVVNHKRESKARLDLYTPVRRDFEMEVREILPENKEVMELCRKEIAEKVSTAVSVPNVPARSGFNTAPDYTENVRRASGDYQDWDMPKKYNEKADEEIEEEYQDQKAYLTKQIKYLIGKKQIKYQTALAARRQELKELLLWGRSTGLEITRK